MLSDPRRSNSPANAPEPNPPANTPEPTAPAALPFPSPEDVRTQLERVVKSEMFAGAARQQRLLRHLVTKRLTGGLGDLKEYTLGVEVFDRGDDFDPRLDPIVRVEASRLRSRLAKYYDGPGAADPIRISLPRGAYVPSFTDPVVPKVEAPEAETRTLSETAGSPEQISVERSDAPAAARPTASRTLIWAAAMLVAVSILAGVVFLIKRQTTLPPAPHYAKFRRITTDGVLCTAPSFSPDDRRLVYAQRDGGVWHLYERDLSTSAWTELTPGSSSDDDYQPAWSPDGQTIVFRSERDGGGLFLLNAKSRTVTRLTEFGYNPAWSPDGHRVVFSTGRFNDPVETAANGSLLKVVDVASKTIQDLTAPGDISALQPAWSPHGYRIAYWDTEPNGDRDIWTVNADREGGAPQPVAVMRDAWTDWSPAWSADGHYLYFSSDRNGAMTLWRVAIDEQSGRVRGNLEPVPTPSSYTGWSAFAHSKNLFAYVRRIPFSELYKVPFDVEKGIDLSAKVQLTEGERGMHEPDISPDGANIVVRIQDPQEDLALIKPDGSGLHRLTNDLFSERTPRWSPDGKRIVFGSNRSHRFELWSIHPDGSELKQLTTQGQVAFTWTPDGTLVGYGSKGPFDLDDPKKPVKDLNLPKAFWPFAWSADGRAVVGRMHSSGFSSNALFVLSPATQDYWEIAAAAPSPSAVWMPHEEQLLFSTSDGFFLGDVRTHQVKQEMPIARNDVHSRFTMSPDRRTVFFVQSDDQQDIWTGSE